MKSLKEHFNNWRICPYCGSKITRYKELIPNEKNEITKDGECLYCKNIWMDVFTYKETREIIMKIKENV